MRKKDKNLIVIEDINLLDLPTCVLDEKGNRKKLDITRPNGTFTMASSINLPNQFDKRVLYCLLTRIVRNGEIFTQEVRTTRYAIANMLCKDKISDTKIFDRIFKALEKYKYTTFKFDGLFYSKDEYTTRLFSYIDDVIFNKQTKELYVKFNQQYMTLIKESGFIKHINFDVYNSLSLPVSARLYEILCKVLEYNSSWTIGLQNLAEKMTLQKRSTAKGYYPSDVLAKIKPGVNEISKKSSLKIEFLYNKESDAITFKRTRVPKIINKTIAPARKSLPTFAPAVKDNISQKPIKNLTRATYLKKFKALSTDEQQAIVSAIDKNRYLDILPDQETKIFAYMKAQGSVLA